MVRQTPKDAPLGYAWSPMELRRWCRTVYGGVAWPGKQPGFAVILGMGRQQHLDGFDIFLLDEAESPDMRALVQQCAALDDRYEPKVWIGDNQNDAAGRFLRELNGQRRHRPLSTIRPSLLDMQQPYQYILPELRRLIDRDRRQLFLKDSRILEYLASIKPDELVELEFRDYPAAEALAMTVIQMRSVEMRPPADPEDSDGEAMDLLGIGRFLGKRR